MAKEEGCSGGGGSAAVLAVLLVVMPMALTSASMGVEELKEVNLNRKNF